jgi:hypothetical protein
LVGLLFGKHSRKQQQLGVQPFLFSIDFFSCFLYVQDVYAYKKQDHNAGAAVYQYHQLFFKRPDIQTTTLRQLCIIHIQAVAYHFGFPVFSAGAQQCKRAEHPAPFRFLASFRLPDLFLRLLLHYFVLEPFEQGYYKYTNSRATAAIQYTMGRA